MYKKKCDYCEKEIEGFTENQVKYLLTQHIFAKHKDKVKIDGN